MMCPAGRNSNANQTICVCPDDTIEIKGVCTICTGGKQPNKNHTACVCSPETFNDKGNCVPLCPANKIIDDMG